MAKSNTNKITKEILEGLSEDTGDSDNYDAESGGEDSEDRPWRLSHTNFGKSTIKQSHLKSMRGRYFRDISIVRAGKDNNTHAPKENEVVIFRSFFKAGLRFPLSRFVVEVLKTFQIFLSSTDPRSHIEDGSLCLGSKEPRYRTKRKMLLQHARTYVWDEGHKEGTVSQQLRLLRVYRPSQRKLPSANILEEVARELDGRMVLCEERLSGEGGC